MELFDPSSAITTKPIVKKQSDSFMEDLFNANATADTITTVVSDTEKKLIFHMKDNEYFLVDSQGQIKSEIHWKQKPKTLSYVFFKHSSDKDRLYTILGDYVKDSECNHIIAVMNFWSVYIRDDQMYISRLVPHGPLFEYEDTMPIEDYGLLAFNGMVVKINGKWCPFRYQFRLIADSEPQTSSEVTAERLISLLGAGFSYNYLLHLCAENRVTPTITVNDEYVQWNKINQHAVEVLKQMTKLISHYKSSDLCKALHISVIMITVLKIYCKIKNVEVLD